MIIEKVTQPKKLIFIILFESKFFLFQLLKLFSGFSGPPTTPGANVIKLFCAITTYKLQAESFTARSNVYRRCYESTERTGYYNGATTLSIMTFSLPTLSITTFSITTLRITFK